MINPWNILSRGLYEIPIISDLFGDFFTDSIMVTIWEKMFGTFSKHRKHRYVILPGLYWIGDLVACFFDAKNQVTSNEATTEHHIQKVVFYGIPKRILTYFLKFGDVPPIPPTGFPPPVPTGFPPAPSPYGSPNYVAFVNDYNRRHAEALAQQGRKPWSFKVWRSFVSLWECKTLEGDEKVTLGLELYRKEMILWRSVFYSLKLHSKLQTARPKHLLQLDRRRNTSLKEE